MLIQLWQQNQRMGQARILAMAIQVLWILRFRLFYFKMIDVEAVTPVMFMYDQTLLFLDGPWSGCIRDLLEKKRFTPERYGCTSCLFFVFAYETYQVAFGDQLAQYFEYLGCLAARRYHGRLWFIVIAGSFSLTGLFVRKCKGSSSLQRCLGRGILHHRPTDGWLDHPIPAIVDLAFMVPLVLYFANYIWPIFDMLTLAGVAGVAIVLLSVIFNEPAQAGLCIASSS